MESNTPVTPQRNRRAGRITALPSEQPLIVPAQQTPPASAQQPVPAVQPSPVTPQPAAPVRSAEQQPRPQSPMQPRQTSGGYAPYPGAVRPPQPRAGYVPYGQTGSAPAQNPAGYPARPAAQSSVRPAQERTVPVGARPQAAGQSRPVRRDDPDARRAAMERRRSAPPSPPEAPPEQHPQTSQTLWTILSLLLVGAMAAVAFFTVRIAMHTTYLRNAETERIQAWENTLFNYHVTEHEDGTYSVTWQDTIEHYAAMYNLDPAFVTAIIRNESSFRTDAESSAGARGLMQMMPDTAEWVAGKLGEPFDFDNLYDPETSIRYGCWYLGYLSDIFQGDTVLVCAAYHAGQGEVLGWLGDSSISPDGVTVPIQNIPISNTKTYAGRVTQAYGIYETLLYSPAPSAADVHGAGHADADRLHSADR